MSNKPLSEEELRQWVLTLPAESIRSLEDTLKSIRDVHFKNVEPTAVNGDEVSSIKAKSELPDDIDVSPPSRTTSPTSSNVSVRSRSKSGKTYENGRRNLKEEDVSDLVDYGQVSDLVVSLEEAGRRAKRRERNRLAAAKCRKRRQDKIDTLQERVCQLKNQMDDLNSSIDQYNSEQERLTNILSSHKCSIHHQQSSSAIRPKDLKIEKSPEQSAPSSNLFICSLSPQLINLSPLLTPSTMKLLIDTINSQQSDSNSLPLIKDEALPLQTSVDSTFFTTISTPSNNFSQSLGLLNLMSPNTDLLNMNLLSSPSLKMAASIASTITSSNISHSQSDHFKQNDQT